MLLNPPLGIDPGGGSGRRVFDFGISHLQNRVTQREEYSTKRSLALEHHTTRMRTPRLRTV
jgi:hypothetical protein